MKLSELVDKLVKLQNMLDHDPVVITKGDHDCYVKVDEIIDGYIINPNDYFIEELALDMEHPEEDIDQMLDEGMVKAVMLV